MFIRTAKPAVLKRMEIAGFPLRAPGISHETLQDAFREVHGRLRIVAPNLFEDWDGPLAAVSVFSLLAHAAKPYGQGTLPDLASMLSSPTLDCSNYGMLTLFLLQIVAPNTLTRLEVHITGWESAAIGNHQLLFAVERDAQTCPSLLDPTTGVIARASFDQIASGIPVSGNRIAAFFLRNDVSSARNAVQTSLMHGAIKPSELLYFFENSEHLLTAFGDVSHWPTPGAMIWRQKYGK